MSKKKKDTSTPVPAPEPETAERQQESKRYLIFYVIALFSVALVLILLSFLSQAKADRELANMGIQLQEQTSAVQGAQARMEVLQQTVAEQTERIAELETECAEQGTAIEQYEAKHAAVAVLLEAMQLQKQGDPAGAKQLVSTLDKYGADQLDGLGEDDLFTEAQAEIYWELTTLDVPEEQTEPAGESEDAASAA